MEGVVVGKAVGKAVKNSTDFLAYNIEGMVRKGRHRDADNHSEDEGCNK